jgi:hypothetical protein
VRICASLGALLLAGCYVVPAPSQTQNPILHLPTKDAGTAPAPDATAPDVLCHRCNNNDDCGSGNFCVPDPKGGSICGMACEKPEDCPTGFLCYPVTDSSNKSIGANCFPTNYGSCFDTTDAGAPAPDADQAPQDAGSPGLPDSGAPDAGSPPPSDASMPTIDAGAVSDGGLLPFGTACTTNTQCATGLCFNFNARGMFCTEMCVNGACPDPTSSGCNGMGVCKVP